MIVSNQSTKTEQNSPIKDVEIELVGNKSRVILHDNIAQEERETDDGNKYIAYTADEVSFYYDGGRCPRGFCGVLVFCGTRRNKRGAV